MFRALFHLVQVTALIAVFGFCLAQQGDFSVVMGSYHIMGQSGFFAAAAFVFILVLLGIHRVWLWVGRLPRTLARRRRDRGLIKGHQALTRSLSALSSGDYKVAYSQGTRAQKLLPDFKELPAVLIAASAERQGMDDIARKSLSSLLDTHARDLAVRGLVNGALARNDMTGALKIAQKSWAETPNVPMLARLVYDLECRNGDFAAAMKRISYLVRHDVLSDDQGIRDRVRMNTALARAAHTDGNHKQAMKLARAAFNLDPSFIPSACELIDLYRGFCKTRAALHVLHKAYAKNPHPDLILRHEQMAPEKGNLSRRIRYHDKLLKLAPDHPLGLMMMARVLVQEGMVGDAQTHLERAADVAPSRAVYRALASLADRNGDRGAEKKYLTAGMSAKADPVWFCPFSNKVYDEWVAITLPDHRFGTVVWGTPDRMVVANPSISTLPVFDLAPVPQAMVG